MNMSNYIEFIFLGNTTQENLLIQNQLINKLKT